MRPRDLNRTEYVHPNAEMRRRATRMERDETEATLQAIECTLSDTERANPSWQQFLTRRGAGPDDVDPSRVDERDPTGRSI